MDNAPFWSSLITRADVIRAPLFKTEPGHTSSSYRVISIKDFPPAGYLPQPDREIHLGTRASRARKYSAQPFDVLVTAVGSIGYVTIVPPTCPDNWVPATNLFLIRHHDDPDGRKSRTFYGLMKSAFGQNILDSLSHGWKI